MEFHTETIFRTDLVREIVLVFNDKSILGAWLKLDMKLRALTWRELRRDCHVGWAKGFIKQRNHLAKEYGFEEVRYEYAVIEGEKYGKV